MGRKRIFCRLPLRVVIQVTLALEATLAVLQVFFPAAMGVPFLAKAALLGICLWCCVEAPCLRMTAAVVFAISAGLEVIAGVALFFSDQQIADMYCDAPNDSV